MRIAIVSDFHGNLIALDAVLADLTRDRFDLILHGGDLATNGARPAEVIDRVRELGWPGVVGNWDHAFGPEGPSRLRAMPEPLQTAFAPMMAWTMGRMGPERAAWIAALPPAHRGEELVLLHAGPGDLWRAPMANASDEELAETYGDLGSERVIYAHIHQPFVRRIGDLTIANSGSVGLPADGDPRASYLVLEDGQIEVRRVEYDVERSVADLYEAGFPGADWVAEIQRTAIFKLWA